MTNKLMGINSDSLKKMILEIYECRDKMSKILDDAEYLVQSTNTYYKTEDGNELRSKFQKFSATFPTFLENIRSYGEDLEEVINIYKKNDLKRVDIFKK